MHQSWRHLILHKHEEEQNAKGDGEHHREDAEDFGDEAAADDGIVEWIAPAAATGKVFRLGSLLARLNVDGHFC